MLFSVILLSVGDDSWRVADGVKFLHFVAQRSHFSVFQRLYVFLNCIYIIVTLLAVSCVLQLFGSKLVSSLHHFITHHFTHHSSLVHSSLVIRHSSLVSDETTPPLEPIKGGEPRAFDIYSPRSVRWAEYQSWLWPRPGIGWARV